jgi:hypothetical protein
MNPYGSPLSPTYDVAIDARCYTEGVEVNVPITEDGSPSGHNTPYTFNVPTGTHSFTVPDKDSSGHAFVYWDSVGSGETSTTIDVSSAGTHIAYYQSLSPRNVMATPMNQAINLTYDPPDMPTGYTVQNYYIYRGTTPDFAIPLSPYHVSAASEHEFDDIDIQDDSIYYYRVAAKFQQGLGDASTSVGCARLESLKGIRTDLSGANSLSIPEWFWFVTFQQNFLLFTGRYDSNKKEIVYWCQNCVVKGMNALSYISTSDMDIFGPTTSDNIGNLANMPLYRTVEIGAPLNDISFVSEIKGSSLIMQNSIQIPWKVNLDLRENARIYTQTSDYPPDSSIDALHASYPPNFVIVGNKGGYHEAFIGGWGHVSSKVKIGNAWIAGVNAKIVGTGTSTAITRESSEGLEWYVNGDFHYNAGTKQEGVFFLPDFESQTEEPVPINSLGQPKNTLIIQAKCPVYLDLYDDQGRCVGYNETSGTVEWQMENAVWESNQTLLVFDPNGTYHVVITGTGNGTYELETSFQDVTGTSSLVSDLNGTITENENQTYAVGEDSNVTVTDILPLETVVPQGFYMPVSVRVADLGGPDAIFNVTLYANETLIGTQSMLSVSGWNSTDVCFTWNMAGLALGNYTLSAYAEPASSEPGTAGSTYVGGTVQIVALSIYGPGGGRYSVR